MASVDSLEDNTAFARKNGATFPILADPDKTMSKAYGVLSPGGYARRWTYYIDRTGTIARIDRNVDPATAGKALVRNLRDLGYPSADP